MCFCWHGSSWFVSFDLKKHMRQWLKRETGCQDTGTAIVMGKKGELVWTDCPSDEEALRFAQQSSFLSFFSSHQRCSRGIHKTYTETSLRYSQLAPLTMFKERNTGFLNSRASLLSIKSLLF